MSDSLFKEGGPLNIIKTGRNEYEACIDIPPDEDGMIGQECPNEECSSVYYRINTETGSSEDDTRVFCPYCKYEDDSDEFHTEAQRKYAEDILTREAEKGADDMISKSFGLGPSGKKKSGGGMLSIEISYKPERIPPVSKPVEEELRRDVLCPDCGLEHAVFGLATWCPCCGSDIFMTHVEQEFNVARRILSEVDARKKKLGGRVAARDLENTLEDVVSIFEIVLRILTRRYLHSNGFIQPDIDKEMKQIGNKYQNIELARQVCSKVLGLELFDSLDEKDIEKIRLTFEKRHLITHNLGIVDRKYLDRVRSGELEGREVPIGNSEVTDVIDLCCRVLKSLHNRLFEKSK